MVEELNHKDPSWLNALLLVAIFLTLGLVLVLAYKGWKEGHALHPSDHEGSSKIIADITINLSGIPYREHCMTCHPQGKAANLPGKPIVSRSHPPILPHSMDDLGCTGCHLGEGMAGDLIISHGRVGMEARSQGDGPHRFRSHAGGRRAILCGAG